MNWLYMQASPFSYHSSQGQLNLLFVVESLSKVCERINTCNASWKIQPLRLGIYAAITVAPDALMH
jgi:hypothetical protein